MSRFFRTILVTASIGLTLVAAALVLWPRAVLSKPVPRHLAEGDQEIAWLYSATSGPTWVRFVHALEMAVDRSRQSTPSAGFVLDRSAAFPQQTTAVAEVAIRPAGSNHRLWIRWYKLSSTQKTREWIEALAARSRPPLVIISGSSSDVAIEAAHNLERLEGSLSADRLPLLLLTTATADAARDENLDETPLTKIFDGRTFRFCFTNRQMAEAVIDFIWSRAELRPDSDPVYVTHWKDDPYSTDLNNRFLDALRLPALRAVARDWAAAASHVLGGGLPFNPGNLLDGFFRMGTPEATWIEHSVGMFDRPNRQETAAAQDILEARLSMHAGQQRPLLVIPAASQPARRFLRALLRYSPSEAQRFIVATGDALSFNLVYRDRNLTWPIQDLPFPLVFFSHRNPVDTEAGFVEELPSLATVDSTSRSSSAGTEDLLLFLDIGQSLLLASFDNGKLVANAEKLRARLAAVAWSERELNLGGKLDDRRLFDASGNRQSGTGEHVVYVRPQSSGGVVQAKSEIAVWKWAVIRQGVRVWRPVKTLSVDYEEWQHWDMER